MVSRLIRVDADTYEALLQHWRPKDSFNKVIKRLLEQYEGRTGGNKSKQK
jgi:predicted CopG family antitoxin